MLWKKMVSIFIRLDAQQPMGGVNNGEHAVSKAH